MIGVPEVLKDLPGLLKIDHIDEPCLKAKVLYTSWVCWRSYATVVIVASEDMNCICLISPSEMILVFL